VTSHLPSECPHQPAAKSRLLRVHRGAQEKGQYLRPSLPAFFRAKSFRPYTYEIPPHLLQNSPNNSFRSNTYSRPSSNSFKSNTYAKTRGGGHPALRSSSSFCSCCKRSNKISPLFSTTSTLFVTLSKISLLFAHSSKKHPGYTSLCGYSIFTCCDHNILWRTLRIFQLVAMKSSCHTDSYPPSTTTHLNHYLKCRSNLERFAGHPCVFFPTSSVYQLS
jgi:hypothetical protein